MVKMTMTRNEKQILTILSRLGPQTKSELASKGHMGWATVVKMLDRLVARSIITTLGKAYDRKGKRGVAPLLYDLCRDNPLAVGVDMEYETTTITLTNLKGSNIATEKYKSPINPSLATLQEFLLESLQSFLMDQTVDQSSIAGIGIGIPGLELPSRLANITTYDNSQLRDFLSSRLGLPIRIDVNVRVYTLYEKWINRPFASEDFILVSIRGGIGLGIILGGRLFVTRQGFAGGIGHYKVVENGSKCRCGRRGCLETVMNEQYLYNSFRQRVLGHRSRQGHLKDRGELVQGVSQLLEEAAQGNNDAISIVQESAKYLSYALAPTLMVLNVPKLILSSHFGPHGDLLSEALTREIRERVLPDLDFSVEYYPLHDESFTGGAALLVLGDYLTPVTNRKASLKL